MKTCPKCHKTYQNNNYMWCEKCGEKLVSRIGIVRHCPKCNRPYDDWGACDCEGKPKEGTSVPTVDNKLNHSANNFTKINIDGDAQMRVPRTSMKKNPIIAVVLRALFGSSGGSTVGSKLKYDSKNEYCDQKDDFSSMASLQHATKYTSIGNKYGGQGDFKKATDAFMKALEYKKDYIPAFLGLSVVYRETGLLDKAIKMLENMPKKMKIADRLIGGSDHDIYIQMTSVYIMKNDRINVKKYAEKALLALDDPERKEMREFGASVAANCDKNMARELANGDYKTREMLEHIIVEYEK